MRAEGELTMTLEVYRGTTRDKNSLGEEGITGTGEGLLRSTYGLGADCIRTVLFTTLCGEANVSTG